MEPGSLTAHAPWVFCQVDSSSCDGPRLAVLALSFFPAGFVYPCIIEGRVDIVPLNFF